MIFRQLFDCVSYAYTYLIASRPGGEALLIDPVMENVDRYLKLLEELDLTLVKAVDTHVHADHITGLGKLRDRTSCVTVMGAAADVDVVAMRVEEGDTVNIEGVSIKVMYTPGHTRDSYSFLWGDKIFTGDALLIRGTGRTDFQNGSPEDAYNSLFNKLLKLPDETIVYPGHDYKGDTVSSIGEERAFNPRLQVSSAEEYAAIMNNLDLPSPKMMDIAIHANQRVGLKNIAPEIEDRTLPANEALKKLDAGSALFIDLREQSEREKIGTIPGSVHVPYPRHRDNKKEGGLLSAFSNQTNQQLLLYCAYGERSAIALKDLKKIGLKNIRHLGGGIDAWINAKGPLEQIAAEAS